MNRYPPRAASLLCLAAAISAPALSQTAPPAAPAAPGRVFTLVDFARYAPKTAYDMLAQLPGFTLRGADDDRGLGQASENVLINGERVADKSGGAIARLRDVSAADVARIEIVQAATLGIPGLTGQVANVVLKVERKASGNFEWKPAFRPHFAKPAWTRGSISYSGTAGGLGYTLTVADGGGRGAIGGADYRITDAAETVTERRDQVLHNEYDEVKLTTLLKYTGKGRFRANLNFVYDPYWNRQNNFQRRFDNGNPNDWRTRSSTNGFSLSASGDVTFGVGVGDLKLIGLRRFEHEPITVLQRATYASGAPDDGVRFMRDSRIGETIGRAEYHWKGGPNDWQVSIERAYNTLDQRGALASLTPAGTFTDIAFPQGSGIVAEERYEGLASLSRPLGKELDLQLVGGAEYSTLRRLDRSEPARNFFRPKGSGSLAWRPAKGWDLNLKLARRVGQISFYDFLAQPDLVLNRGNDANPLLVPPQSWELTGEVGRDFGRWGKTRLKLHGNRIEDIVDHIPVGPDGDAVGNLPHASRLGIESKSTFQFDPLGLAGAKLDATIGAERSRVRDPLTGRERPISGTYDRWASLNFRHDVAGTQFAWGAGMFLDHYGWSYYLDEANRNWEGPYVTVFVEHKNIAGLKVRLEAFNVNDGRSHFDRVVYTGRRTFTPIAFEEHANQLIGPIFTLSVRGTF